MSYTPPSGNAVAFSFPGKTYVAPAGDALAFSFLTEWLLTAGGSLGFAGAGDVAHGVSMAAAGACADFSGSASFTINVDMSAAEKWQVGGRAALSVSIVLVGVGKAATYGNAQLSAAPNITGRGTLQTAGGAAINTGGMLLGSGKYAFGGIASIRVGTSLSARGGLSVFMGSGQLRHGVSVRADDVIALTGGASLVTLPVYSLIANGEIAYVGIAEFSHPRSVDQSRNTLFVATRPETVTIHGL